MALVRIDSHLPVVLALGDVYYASQRRTTPAVASQRLHTGTWDGLDVLAGILGGTDFPTDVHDFVSDRGTPCQWRLSVRLASRRGYRELDFPPEIRQSGI